jgi:hypothetical protein
MTCLAGETAPATRPGSTSRRGRLLQAVPPRWSPGPTGRPAECSAVPRTSCGASAGGRAGYAYCSNLGHRRLSLSGQPQPSTRVPAGPGRGRHRPRNHASFTAGHIAGSRKEAWEQCREAWWNRQNEYTKRTMFNANRPQVPTLCRRSWEHPTTSWSSCAPSTRTATPPTSASSSGPVAGHGPRADHRGHRALRQGVLADSAHLGAEPMSSRAAD